MGEASTKDRILDTFVYAPLGFALYARDAAPGFARMFIARGRHEFDRHKGQVSEQINEGVETAMSVGQQAMASAPEVRRRVEGGVGQARGLVEDVVTNLRDGASQVVPNGGSAATAPAAPTAPATPATPATPPPPAPTPEAPAPAPSTFESPTRDTSAGPAPSSPPPAPSGPTPSTPAPSTTSTSSSTSKAALPIPDYDELAASQVVERLEGLDLTELEAVADYERARRGRRTILGKIEQLTA